MKILLPIALAFFLLACSTTPNGPYKTDYKAPSTNAVSSHVSDASKSVKNIYNDTVDAKSSIGKAKQHSRDLKDILNQLSFKWINFFYRS